MRYILHVDMDAFYASVEQNDKPDLRGKPVVVGSPSDRGVIAAASYEARKFGVRSAMPSSIAKRLCPELVFVKHRMGRYKEVSERIFEIFARHSNIVEALSIDEAFIDLSHIVNGLSEAVSRAKQVKHEIFSQTGLTASVGISFNKFLAKLASDMKKPDGLYLIDNAVMESILPSLPVEKLFGIGKVTAGKMHLYGIHTCKDLREADMDFLTRNFGKAGNFYYGIARGEDSRPVEPGRLRKSVGAELTFDSDLSTKFQVIAELYKIEKILWDRILKHGSSGRTLTLKVKYDDFKQISRSHTLDKAIGDFNELHREVVLLRDSVDFKRKKVRLMGVTISGMGDADARDEQLYLWD
ncbi:MAG: DNA polymerase IV [Marinilabiliaceae bacterium]|nr:DNA polymerase IV [Marinilabiliaceae bacterium]